MSGVVLSVNVFVICFYCLCFGFFCNLGVCILTDCTLSLSLSSLSLSLSVKHTYTRSCTHTHTYAHTTRSLKQRFSLPIIIHLEAITLLTWMATECSMCFVKFHLYHSVGIYIHIYLYISVNVCVCMCVRV